MATKRFELSNELATFLRLAVGATLTRAEVDARIEEHLNPVTRVARKRAPKAPPTPAGMPFLAAKFPNGGFVVFRRADLEAGKPGVVRSADVECPNCQNDRVKLPQDFERGRAPDHVVCTSCGKEFDLEPIPDEYFGYASAQDTEDAARRRRAILGH